MEKQKNILRFQIISFIVVSILGALLHFTYEWSNETVLVGTFSAVNESTWEHLKLLFFPMLLMTVIGYFYIGKETRNFVCAKTIGIIVAMIFTVVFFYTYSGILGEVIDIINIISFFVAVLMGEYVAYKIMRSEIKCNFTVSVAVIGIMLLLFIVFTFKPPHIGLFEDPITHTYGIQQKKL